MDQEKEQALKSILGDAPAAEVLAGAEAVQKDADDKRTAYKSADDPWAVVLTSLKAAVATMITPPEPVAESPVEPEPVAEKAPPPMVEEDVVTEEPAVVEEQAMDDMGGGEMSADEFLAQIGALIDAKLAPIAGLLDIEKKVAGHVASLMQPYQAQKDASDAEKVAEIASLKAQQTTIVERLAALEGDQPSAWKAPWGGYRATEDDATTTTKEQAETLGLPALDDDAEWQKLRNGLFGLPTNGVTN